MQSWTTQKVQTSILTQEVRNSCNRPFKVYYKFGPWERLPFTPNISPRYLYGQVAARGSLRKVGGWEATSVIADC